MRKIKFRIWDKKDKSFTEEPYFRWTIANNGYLYNSENDEWHETSDKYEVSLFMGLLDKNGKEIYEGDIVKDRFDRIMKIGYWNYRFCFIAISKTNFHHADFYDWEKKGDYSDENEMGYTGIFRVEVIGNIYETPELLKRTTE